jgi:hypothetical protein
MRKIKRSSIGIANPYAAHLKAVEGVRSNVFPIHPGWPPAELPQHECGLRHVGLPNSISRETKNER